MDENIISRVKKLLNLANQNSNATQAEMELALSHARRLAIEHDLDLAVLSQTEQVIEEKYENREIDLGKRFSVCQKFVNWILKSHFKVEVIRSGSRCGGRRICLIGKTSDIQIGEYVQSFLNSEFMKLWRAAKEVNGWPAKDRNSYIYGLYKGLDCKLATEKQSAEKTGFANVEATRGTVFLGNVQQTYTLALVNEKQARLKARDSFFPTLRHNRIGVGVVRNSGAYAGGYSAGQNISVRQGLNSGGNLSLR